MPAKGGQPGNQNARRAKYPRLVVSFSGKELIRVYEKLALQGELSPTEERIKAFIKQEAIK